MSDEETEEKKWTVGELKKMLETVPDDLEVCHEGCDCIGYWDGKIEVSKPKIYLGRRN